MSAHDPKIAALLAYDAGVLSDAGRRRLEAHLEACAVCTDALAAMRAYESLRADTQAAPLPPVDFMRMEFSLRQEAKRSARELRERSLFAPLSLAAVAAALLLFFFVDSEVAIEPGVAAGSVSTSTSTSPLPEPLRAAGHARLTLVAGSVDTDGSPASGPGQVLREGARLTVGARSEAHLRFATGTGLVLGSGTSAELRDLDEGRLRVSLAAGTVSNRVAHLGAGDRYEVAAGPYMVEVRGTHFAVTRDRDDVAVLVEEGVVEVLRDGAMVARVPAPGRWHSGVALWGAETVAEPVGLEEDADEWPAFAVPFGDDTQRVRLLGQEFDVASLALSVAPGEVGVERFSPDGEIDAALFVIDEGGEVSEGSEPEPDAPAARAGFLAPELIAPPVRAGMRRLQGCHQQEARRGEPPSGVFALSVTIGLSGQVQRADLVQRRGTPPSAAFRACVLDEARTWLFPPPTGGSVTFEQPLRFTTVMR